MKTSDFKYKANTDTTIIESVLVSKIFAVNDDEAIRYAKAVLKKYGRLEAEPTVIPGKYGEWAVQFNPKS